MATQVSGLLTDPRVREAYPVLKDVVYLNVGTYGIMPTPALEAFQAIQGEFEQRGIASNHTCGRKTEETRQRLAALLGVTPEEIAFTRNATDGINLTLAGIDWQPGDEVIITDEEHEAINHPTMYLHNTKGVVVRRVSVSPDAAVMRSRLEAAWSPRTRLAALSFVSCESGTRLPGQAIADWAREKGVLSLLDGAQVTGAMKVDLREIGCDFYTSNGHKWMSAPKGTGFFYGKRESLLKLSPAHVGAGSLETYDLATETAVPFSTGQRFEFGTRAWGLTAGGSASLDWFESLGWDNVYGHVAALADHFKERIQERPGLRLLTPVKAEESAGLTSFVIEGHEAQKVSQAMREQHNIFLRVIPHYNAIRVSTAHFNNEEDIDKLMRGLEAYRTQ